MELIVLPILIMIMVICFFLLRANEAIGEANHIFAKICRTANNNRDVFSNDDVAAVVAMYSSWPVNPCKIFFRGIPADPEAILRDYFNRVLSLGIPEVKTFDYYLERCRMKGVEIF